jgi:hypothetical protein
MSRSCPGKRSSNAVCMSGGVGWVGTARLPGAGLPLARVVRAARSGCLVPATPAECRLRAVPAFELAILRAIHYSACVDSRYVTLRCMHFAQLKGCALLPLSFVSSIPPPRNHAGRRAHRSASPPRSSQQRINASWRQLAWPPCQQPPRMAAPFLLLSEAVPTSHPSRARGGSRRHVARHVVAVSASARCVARLSAMYAGRVG